MKYLVGFFFGMMVAAVAAQTSSIGSTGLHTTSICNANGEWWQEMGLVCHSDKMFRNGISNEAQTATVPNNLGLPAMDVVGIMMAGESPTHKAKTIKVDEDGYIICSHQ